MSLTYAQYKTQIATMAVVAEDDTNFLIILPQAIEYATLRMCRDIDFLSTVTVNTTLSLSANNRTLTMADGLYVTIQEVNIITPVGTSNPTLGTRNPCLPTSKEVLDYLYSSSTNAAVPSMFAMLNQNTIIVGPWPNANYSVELVGTVRPALLSATNTTTAIATYFPDMFVQASMIYLAEYQRNFGDAAASDPQMGTFYESQYQALLPSALTEENRKKWASVGWTSMSPSPVSSPSR